MAEKRQDDPDCADIPNIADIIMWWNDITMDIP